MFPKGKSSTPPSDAQAKEKLAMYVYEYLMHVGAQKAASQFLTEIRCEKQLPVGEAPGFLVQWWSVFYDLYSAAPERRETYEHSNEAKAFHDYGFVNSCYPNGMAHGPGMPGGGPMPPMPGPQEGAMMPGGGPGGPGMPPGFFPGMPGPMNVSQSMLSMEGRPCIPVGPMGGRLPPGARFPPHGGPVGMPPPFVGPGGVRHHPASGPSSRPTPPPPHSLMQPHSVMPPGGPGGSFPMSPGPPQVPPNMNNGGGPMSMQPMMAPPTHNNAHVNNNHNMMPPNHPGACGPNLNGPGTPGGIMPSPQEGSVGGASSIDGMMAPVGHGGPSSLSGGGGGPMGNNMRMGMPNGPGSAGLMGPPIAPPSTNMSGSACGVQDEMPVSDVSMMGGGNPSSNSCLPSSSGMMPPSVSSAGPPMMSMNIGPPHSSQMMMMNGGGGHPPNMMMGGPGGPPHPGMLPMHPGMGGPMPPEMMMPGNGPPDYFPGGLPPHHPHHPSHMMMGGPGPMMGMPSGPPMSSHHLQQQQHMGSMSSHPSQGGMPPVSHISSSQASGGGGGGPPLQQPPHSMQNNNSHNIASSMSLADRDNAAILKIKEQMQEDVKSFEKSFDPNPDYFGVQQQ